MDRISALPLAKAHIQYQSVMTSVEYEKQRGQVRVTTAHGRHQVFDDVVITTPLGWLKKHMECIRDLSPRIRSAIDAMSFGRLEKVGILPTPRTNSLMVAYQVLIEFPSAFWDSANADDAVSFVHWLRPTYAAKTNPQQWRLECVSFNAFPDPYRRNILLFYTYGDCATYVTNSIHGLQGKERDGWLRQFFEPYYSRLPGYTNACAPLRYLATEWCSDEFGGNGCYSNFQVGMSDAANDVRAIRNGMPEKHVFFAGEHTSPFDGLGTVAGAYNSGEAIARRIVAGHESQLSDQK